MLTLTHDTQAMTTVDIAITVAELLFSQRATEQTQSILNILLSRLVVVEWLGTSGEQI